jgi:5-aminopentanamidase
VDIVEPLAWSDGSDQQSRRRDRIVMSNPSAPPDRPSIQVTCLQLAPQIGELAANRELSTTAIATAAGSGSGLIVLPELVTSGYVFESADEARSLAITPNDPVFADWAAAAGDAVVIGGFCELGADGLVYNSAAVVDADGVFAVYRKTHLWDAEKHVFTPGSAAPPVLATKVGSVGLLICYDLEFPELTRGLALAGAEILAVPTNWPLMPRPEGERPGEVSNAMVTARANRIFIACCDRAGSERGQDWTEGTAIIDVSGWVIAEPRIGMDGVPTATARLDPTLAWDKTISPNNDVLADRRPEIYAQL